MRPSCRALARLTRPWRAAPDLDRFTDGAASWIYDAVGAAGWSDGALTVLGAALSVMLGIALLDAAGAWSGDSVSVWGYFIVLGCLAVFAAPALIVEGWVRGARFRRRLREYAVYDRCAGCGYSMNGLRPTDAVVRCPECGRHAADLGQMTASRFIAFVRERQIASEETGERRRVGRSRQRR